MKLKKGVIIQEIDGQNIAIDGSDVGERFHGLIRMNKTAAFIALALEDELSMDELVKKMTEKYIVTEDEAKESAEKVIEKLRECGLLEEA
ncbi:MAG: PqqD family protein [Lachnospiraceae bacterium]|nr:PqqD family protein [Lachnospiraceae bacterium]